MLSKERSVRDKAGDYFMRNIETMAKAYLPQLPKQETKAGNSVLV